MRGGSEEGVSAVSPDLLSFLSHLLGVAKACYEPCPRAARAKLRPRAQQRLDADPTRVTFVQPERSPETWTEEEAYLRTGVWCGAHMGESEVEETDDEDEDEWTPTVDGGSDVHRPLGEYAATERSMGTQSNCNKYKESKQRLLPGCLLGWCLDCGTCCSFSVMANAESPRTVFELLRTRWKEAPEMICYDNGCNTMQYCLNREPKWFKGTRFVIDHMHYNDHKHCPLDYDSYFCPSIKNSSLAEQRNRIIRTLEHNCGYMTQLSFLVYFRHFVHRMNKWQRNERFWGER